MFSVRTYLILTHFVVLLLLFPIFSGYFWNRLSELRDAQLVNNLTTLQTSMENRGVVLVNSMSMSIHEAIAGFNFTFINSLLKKVVESDHDLEYCLVIDPNGVVYAHNNMQLVGSIVNDSIDITTKAFFTEKFPASYDSRASDRVEILGDENNTMHFIAPVYNGNSLWGALRCGYSIDSLQENIRVTKHNWITEMETMRSSFFNFIFVFFCIALAATLFFTGRFIKAIKRLNVGVKRISGGDLEHDIGEKGLWLKELKSFAVSFNQMTNSLRISRRKLDDYNQSLEETVRMRTEELEATNKELEAFSYSVSHDLRAPLRAINGHSQALYEDYNDKLDEDGKYFLERIQYSTEKMHALISGMLTLSRIGRQEIALETLDLSTMATKILHEIQESDPNKANELEIESGLTTIGDFGLVNIVLQNLLSNAWKYSSKQKNIKIDIGRTPEIPDTFFVKDNGTGFDMKYASKLFTPFQRLHKPEEFEGTGIGLATVARIINMHGGKIWVESEPGEGTTFYFSFRPVNPKVK